MLIGSFLPAQTIVKSITHGGLNRTARVYVPATYSPANPAPLVFNLHGFTSNAFQQELYSEMNAVADTAGFIAVYPEGVNATWNAGLLPNSVDDVGFISVLIDSLNADYNIDLARVYSCGMSMGGFMSFKLACELDDRIAAIASVTGLFATDAANNCSATRPVPVLQMHGTADPTVIYNGAPGYLSVDSTINFWRNRNNCNDPVVVTNLPDIVFEGSTGQTFFYGGCDGGTEVLHYKFAQSWTCLAGCIAGGARNHQSGCGRLSRDLGVFPAAHASESDPDCGPGARVPGRILLSAASFGDAGVQCLGSRCGHFCGRHEGQFPRELAGIRRGRSRRRCFRLVFRDLPRPGARSAPGNGEEDHHFSRLGICLVVRPLPVPIHPFSLAARPAERPACSR
jgi:poly(3-hydroxybutyrate) depolymerase